MIKLENRFFRLLWQITLVLCCLSVFVSKSGLSIAGTFLLLLSCIIIEWGVLWRERKGLLLIVFLYPLAILLSFFSLGGTESAFKVLISWPWPLFVLPAYVVSKRKDDQKIVLVTLCISLLFACVQSYLIFFKDFNGVFDSDVRVRSFWDISRWGVFLVSAILGLLAMVLYFDRQRKRKYVIIFQILALMAEVSLILSNTRAPWISAGVSVFLMVLFFPRLFKFSMVMAFLLIVMLSFNEGMRDRLASVLNIQSANGRVTSTDASNEARLYMWKVGAEFFWGQPWFGTGFENSERYLRTFVDSKPGYKEKYITDQFSFRDHHSSYLAMFVQMGAIFAIIFWGIYFGAFFLMFKNWHRTRDLWSGTVFLLMIAHSVMFVFYTSVQSFEMIALFPFIGLIPKAPDIR
ncbi:O-antigen ligase family protein [Bdellovibrio sp. 22V]|uniref:O-antigen ligase family protein n=1 Tax=Bdellovibrio sp. 22V TaxID=3044166 RepID=UPI002543CEF6|nr:O-antigen ligase family protein [Bdellovibrio sp. 22V]WII71845.1 O-antigen ligase family protein [Bdellovibrio sp. 22V]